MIPTFVDASFWIALRNRRDEFHARARDLGVRLHDERAPLITTPFIFAEVHAYFVRSVALREQVIADFWDRGLIRIEDPTAGDQAVALDLLRQQRDKNYSFCDALSFAFMQRKAIHRALAFDEHFEQFGTFTVLR